MAMIAWGAKVSRTFLDRVRWIVDDLEMGANEADGMCNLMVCISWETGRKFSPSIKNAAGSGATGLIQFMPAVAKALGTTPEKLAKMTPEDQLNYVWKYFEPYKGKLKTLSDMYMAILWPAAVGKPETYVLWEKGSKPTTYRQNAGLDVNKDGAIIKAEATAKLTAMLAEGMKEGNYAEYDAAGKQYPDAAPAIVAELAPTILPVPTELVQEATDVIGKTKTAVTETADAVTTVVVEPKNTATAIKHAISGWQGNLAGTLAIVTALLLDPTFSAALGRFTTSLASGQGRWGAFVALIGAGAIIYRAKGSIK